MKLTLLLAVIICTSLFYSKAHAQEDNPFPDYFIGIHGDTVRCTIRSGFSFGTNKLKYKTINDKKYQILGFDSIKLFFIATDSNKYVLKKLPKMGEKIVSVVEQGRINLYKFSTQVYTSGYNLTAMIWYGEKNKDSLKQVKTTAPSLFNTFAIGSNKEREQNFMDLIADNKSLLDRFTTTRKDAEYSYDLIQYYIKTYNEDYEESKKMVK